MAVSGLLPREALLAIEAGEIAGELSMVLLMLGEYFELRSEMKKKFLSALTYPMIVMGILLVVLCYVVFEVIPKVSDLLPSGAMASPMTLSLMAGAGFLKGNVTVICFFITLLIIGVLGLLRFNPGFYREILSRIPLVGQILKERELSLGFFALYVLQKSGIPLSLALREASKVAGGQTQRHMEGCSLYLIGGLSLSEAVRRNKYFPRFTADTLRIGEESGRFEEYFERLYRIFYRSFQARMEYLSVLIRPALLIMASGFIVFIALGFFQPLYGSLSLIASP